MSLEGPYPKVYRASNAKSDKAAVAICASLSLLLPGITILGTPGKPIPWISLSFTFLFFASLSLLLHMWMKNRSLTIYGDRIVWTNLWGRPTTILNGDLQNLERTPAARSGDRWILHFKDGQVPIEASWNGLHELIEELSRRVSSTSLA